MLIARVIQHQLGNHPQSRFVRRVQELLEILESSERRINRKIIGDIISVIPERGWVEGQQPDCGDTEILQVIEF